MEGFNVAQAIVTTVAMTLIMTPMLVLSFLAGRRSNSQGKSHRIDNLQPDVLLAGTSWLAEFASETDPAVSESFPIQFEQTGSRFLASGRSVDGTLHSFEGVIHHGRLCCLSIDENPRGIWLGTVTVELNPGGRKMTGMRTRWSSPSQTLMIRGATFTRLDTSVSNAEPDVSR